MTFSAIPLAFLAGILSLLSPCVLPMLPAVTASAMRSSVKGLWVFAAGLALSFALSGSVLTFVLLNLGLSTEILRTVSAIALLLMGLLILSKKLGDSVRNLLSRGLSYLPVTVIQGDGVSLQFVIGMTLGLVWLPCVGPTLGTAIALASTGQNMGMAFIVMLSFGLGTALPLIALGYSASKNLRKLRHSERLARLFMGWALLLVATMILTGFDRVLEMWAMHILPSWVIEI